MTSYTFSLSHSYSLCVCLCVLLQSLGQNFLSDQNYVRKIVNVFTDDSEVTQLTEHKPQLQLQPQPQSLSLSLLLQLLSSVSTHHDSQPHVSSVSCGGVCCGIHDMRHVVMVCGVMFHRRGSGWSSSVPAQAPSPESFLRNTLGW